MNGREWVIEEKRGMETRIPEATKDNWRDGREIEEISLFPFLGPDKFVLL